jgi:hypothetical protein
MRIFKAIGDFFKGIFFPKFKTFLSAVFTKANTIIMAEIQDVVQEVVKELSVETLTNTQKRNEAYSRVVAELESRGQKVSESIVRATIEMAVVALKSETVPEETTNG